MLTEMGTFLSPISPLDKQGITEGICAIVGDHLSVPRGMIEFRWAVVSFTEPRVSVSLEVALDGVTLEKREGRQMARDLRSWVENIARDPAVDIRGISIAITVT